MTKAKIVGDCNAPRGSSLWACHVRNAVGNGHWYGTHDDSTVRLVNVTGTPLYTTGDGIYRLCEAQRQAILKKAWGDTVVFTLRDDQEETTNPCITLPSLDKPCTNCGRTCSTVDIKCWWCERLHPTDP
jgi:hypothetical protein